MKEVKASLIVRVITYRYEGVTHAEVTLKSADQGVRLESIDDKGTYRAQGLAPGAYEITVEAKGYQADSRQVDLVEGNNQEVFILGEEGMPYYYRGKVRHPFKPMDDLIAVVMASAPAEKPGYEEGQRAEVVKIAEEFNLEFKETGKNIARNGIYILRFPDDAPEEERQEIVRSLGQYDNISHVGQALKLLEQNATLLTNEIIVRFDDEVDDSTIERLAGENNLRIRKRMAVLGNVYRFAVDGPASYEVLEVCNRLAPLDFVVYAEPNLIHTVEDDAYTPTDFLFPQQWDHELLNTTEAWEALRDINVNRTFGHPGVIIAVVDTGVDAGHPEFSGNLTDGNPKVYQLFDFRNMVANNDTLTSDHGTCCASTAAGKANNPSAVAGINEGVAGVAGNCRLIGIRRGPRGDEALYAEMYLWLAGFDPESDEAGFPGTISPGADMITNSFGYSAGSAISALMSDTFDRLTDDGRDGKGVLLFFSAGNGYRDLDTTFFRPWGMYDRCFSVAASTLDNDGVTEVKADYSCWGSVIEFCAPGHDEYVNNFPLHDPTTNYGAFAATVRAANPLQMSSLNGPVNAGDDLLTLNDISIRDTGVVLITDGANTEAHMFRTIEDAADNNTNQMRLTGSLANNHPSGTPVSVYPGFTPGTVTQQDTLDGAVNAGDWTIQLDDATGFTVGEAMLIGEPGDNDTESALISSVNGDQITVGRPLLKDHPDGTNVRTGPANYKNCFGGTSHSAPLCAGVAALMLSANPDLEWDEVRDILRDTAAKIDPNNTNATGRWRDPDGRISTDPAYTGPFFSEFFGYGRIDAEAAVKRAGWLIELHTPNLVFNDVAEGETVVRAIRFTVQSLWETNFQITSGPGAPFDAPFGTSASLGPSSDFDAVREVYMWISYTGTTAGDMARDSVTVRNPETEQEWTIPITANTISRPSAVIMLTLDKSESMTFASGIEGARRIDVLRFSANILFDVLHEGDGAGIVAFDHDPHDVRVPPVGPLGPPDFFDPDRDTLRTDVRNFTPNPHGLTAIGDGVERAQLRLDPVTGYGTKSVIVFTDGKETAAKYISEVSDQITDRVFAVGLGLAHNINPGALNALANNTGGYLLLTGALDNDSRFKLGKYFLQVLAGVRNEDVVVDPDGWIHVGQQHRIPFTLNEADISADVILMVPDQNLIQLAVETPSGDLITPRLASATPGALHYSGQNVDYYRLSLPVPIGAGAREGKWHALLRVDGDCFQKYVAKLEDYPELLETVQAHGVQYTLVVHAFSNLRMRSYLFQDSHEPGATISLQIMLAEYGLPVDGRAEVTATVVQPYGMSSTLKLKESQPGVFKAQLRTEAAGIYTFRITAQGKTLRGRMFVREAVQTGAVWKGGDEPFPTSPVKPEPRPDKELSR